MERRTVFRALVGSHNYGLATPTSDKDFKVFVMPIFDDLYGREQYAIATVTDTEDNDVHDIRKLTDLLWRANINFIEVLYTTQLETDITEYPEIEWVFAHKHELATMNLKYLYQSCMGMHIEKMKKLEQGTASTQVLVDLYQYDTKQALHCYRVLDFITRMHKFENDFGKSMTYNKLERMKMLRIKKAQFPTAGAGVTMTVEQFKSEVIVPKLSEFHGLSRYFKSFEPNETLKEELEEQVKSLVRRGIKQELGTVYVDNHATG